MVLVGEQYVQCLAIWHIVPLGLWAMVVVVLRIVDSLFFGNYLGCWWGTLREKAGLGQRVWKN